MRRAVAAGAVCLLLPVTGGCGEASEERIARERAEAAEIARQDERLKQLERELRRGRSSSANAAPAPPPTPAQTRPSTPPGGVSIRTWPAGVDAYTVVLNSETTKSIAEAKAHGAARAGEPAGVLLSDDYPSLRPGYWVVFSGQFSSAARADRDAARLRSLGYSGAYAREVSGG